jgi:ornithine cyclodeaminase
MLQLDAAALAARLDRRALIDALEDAFRGSSIVPERQHYEIESANPGHQPGTLLVMPAWRVGAAIGIKLVTIFPDNASRSLPAVAATYLLLDAQTGRPKALIDGGELTLRRTGAASALASRFLSAPDRKPRNRASDPRNQNLGQEPRSRAPWRPPCERPDGRSMRPRIWRVPYAGPTW